MLVYEPHIMPDPLIPVVFHTDTMRGGQKEHPNWHTNIEILCCIKGSGTVDCEGTEHDFTVGDIFVINSNNLHTIYSDSEVVYHCLIVDRDFCRTNGVPTDKALFKNRIRDERLNKEFDKVVEAVKVKDSLRAAEIRLAVLNLLITLKRYYVETADNNTKKKESVSFSRVKLAMIYIRENLANVITLEDIASYVGISKYYLTREFKLVTGQTIFEYLNVVRCKEAKRLIRDGMTASEAAGACGFSNMSYFTRTYKKCVNELPSFAKITRKKEKEEESAETNENDGQKTCNIFTSLI
ncbi:MAG: AraC family transcriptional regulator [Clostridiales bacterium]|nr:helix-turn-helix transcriptional regulator [Clostridia bacterium]MCR5353245.1 AraC family transcriptional regulator [Clostridiales bacterium]